MERLILLIGLPGCGKSTYAKKLAFLDSRTKVFSSDEYRERLYGDECIQDNPGLVFDTLRKDVACWLKADKRNKAVIDATNIKRKDRGTFRRLGVKYGAAAVIFITPLDVCKERNRMRQRVVPEKVIERMSRNFQMIDSETENWIGYIEYK